MIMDEFKYFFKTLEGNEGNKCHYPTRLDTYGCIVEQAREYIHSLGGFERFAEWGLIR